MPRPRGILIPFHQPPSCSGGRRTRFPCTSLALLLLILLLLLRPEAGQVSSGQVQVFSSSTTLLAVTNIDFDCSQRGTVYLGRSVCIFAVQYKRSKGTMGLSRRFLNMIVASRLPGVKSLLRIDLTRQQLLKPTAGAAAISQGEGGPPALNIGSFRLPKPILTFRASASARDEQSKIDCFPLGDCKVVSVDQSGRAVLFDADTPLAGTLPSIHKPTGMPISLFVPKTDDDANLNHEGFGSSLFLMDRILKPEAEGQQKNQLSALVYHKTKDGFRRSKTWQVHLLPPSPFLHDTFNCPQITSYAPVHGGSHICISVEGVGTYCLDTTTHTWSKLGKWMLPFHGKVEYVPELNLWFGFSAKAHHLAAADLSNMDSQPQLLGAWNELDPREEWEEFKDPQLVNLGSGRFCIARFFQTREVDVEYGDELIHQNFAVFTGVDVAVDGNGGSGKVDLQLIPRISKRLDNIDIETLF